ncbi:MAG: hypothetical protein KA371_20025 [Acidobacteria bacterium]|nr:hypothetical protein [Acidobacteriota bacterium]
MSVSYQHSAPGTSTIFFASTGLHLRYRCDTLGHRIVVSDEAGNVVRVFGGFGRKAGGLDTPLDVVFVRPEFAGERLPMDSADAVWVAVADYGNRRVQVFELDGTVVGEFAVDQPGGAPWVPTSLTWRAPVLEVEGVEGARTAVHLSAALLAGAGHTNYGRFLPGGEARH